MAVREIATNNYFKINFDSCAVRGLKVFVNFSVYQSAEEREKEKERKSKWAEFFQKLRESIQAKYNALIAQVEALGLTPDKVLSATEDGKIDAGLYPVLRAEQDKLDALAPFELGIGERLFKYGDNEKPALVISEEVGEALAALGFEDEWIINPVLLGGGAEVNTGDYNGEPITHELFYERLKLVMGDTEDC